MTDSRDARLTEERPDGPDWSLIRAFAAVMRSGSLTRAADELGQTQPTLGRQIRALEAELGETLFDRLPSGLVPRERALALYERAQAMEEAAAGFARAFARMPEALSGTVRVTSSEAFGTAVLPRLLAPFTAANPAISIEVVAANVTLNLMRREADIAVRFVRPEQPDVITQRLGEVELGLFAHRDHLATHGMPESFADLARFRLVGPDRDEIALRYAAKRGVQMTRMGFVFRSDSWAAQHAAVRAGIGIGPMHTWMARGHPDLVRVLPGEFAERLEVWICAHEDLRRSRRVRAVYDHMSAALRVSLAGELRP